MWQRHAPSFCCLGMGLAHAIPQLGSHKAMTRLLGRAAVAAAEYFRFSDGKMEERKKNPSDSHLPPLF